MPATAAPSIANLLWTGGWDSSYRLLDLLLVHGRPVQPYYIVETTGRTAAAEQDAMRRIRELLRTRHPQGFALLRPTIEIALADIPPNDRLTANFERCLQHAFIGGQYEWFARLCAERRIEQLELSIHRDDKARVLLADLVDPSRTRVDPRFAGDPRYELFRFFRFPLFDLTKQDMRARARQAGFDEYMALTWFCHRPRAGQPCGVCNPCIYTIEEGLGERVPLAGRIRYRLRILPRLRHALVRRPWLYLRARALYDALRGRKRVTAGPSAAV